MFKSSIYFLVLAANLIVVQVDWPIGIFATKPLLIPLLAWMLSGSSGKEMRWVGAALFFSWVGDMLLMLPVDLFVFGLGSFLIAHLFYIRYFFGIWNQEKYPLHAVTILMIIVYLVGLIWLLSPVLGPLKIPVILYGTIISLMLFVAIQTGIRSLQIGAALFVLSDSLLAINKFHTPFPSAGAAVMLTYGLAQFYLVRGTRKI
jgi:uncharacterized membrane protein YhhN